MKLYQELIVYLIQKELGRHFNVFLKPQVISIVPEMYLPQHSF